MEQSSTSVASEVTDQRPPKAQRKSIVLPAVLVIVGLLVMLYPVVSTAWNNHNASKIADEYAKLDKETPQEVKDAQWEKAHAYNEERSTGPILDPWLNRISPQNPEYAKYLDQLNENEAMARFIFPEIKVDLPILHGTSEETLQRGLGHLYGSDLPVGGEGTHSVITGHTGLSNSTMFDNLKNAKEGESFFIQVSGHKLKYEIDQIKVVLPHETDELQPVAGKDYVTLITCTPYGINTHRLLVRGHQVPLDEDDKEVFENSHGAGWQWWMYALLFAVVALGGLFVWWLLRQRKRSLAIKTAAEHYKVTQNVGEGEIAYERLGQVGSPVVREYNEEDGADYSQSAPNTDSADEDDRWSWKRDND